MTPYTVQPGDRIFLIGFGFVFLLLFFLFFLQMMWVKYRQKRK